MNPHTVTLAAVFRAWLAWPGPGNVVTAADEAMFEVGRALEAAGLVNDDDSPTDAGRLLLF